jgi:hypothetical protein
MGKEPLGRVLFGQGSFMTSLLAFPYKANPSVNAQKPDFESKHPKYCLREFTKKVDERSRTLLLGLLFPQMGRPRDCFSHFFCCKWALRVVTSIRFCTMIMASG